MKILNEIVSKRHSILELILRADFAQVPRLSAEIDSGLHGDEATNSRVFWPFFEGEGNFGQKLPIFPMEIPIGQR
jgi:hypothetical protein